MTDPGSDGLPRRLGNLELDGPLRFLLQHDRPRCDGLTMADIPNPQAYEVTGPQFAVDRQVKQGKFATPRRELQSHANCPDLFELEGRLLANDFALVPGWADSGSVLGCFYD
jgi:hypothetical protein